MESNKCKNCESPLNGKFCSSCGQKVYSEKDKSIRNLFHEAFHFMTHFEGKFFNTLKTIYRYRGKLSLDYSNGIRQRYYKPISFYLLIVVLYLLFPIASGMNVEMKYHKSNPIFGKYISHQIENRLIYDNITEEQLSEKFHKKSKNTSKFLLLLLIPFSVPILYLLYLNKRRYLFDNFILLTEVNIFFLLSFFILVPIAFLPFLYFFDISMGDRFFAPLSIVLFSFYCVFLFRKVFQEKWWISILKGTFFGLLFLFMINTIYKAIVFVTTFALI
jgi:hypothetical protein